jgi:hypothetical protein
MNGRCRSEIWTVTWPLLRELRKIPQHFKYVIWSPGWELNPWTSEYRQEIFPLWRHTSYDNLIILLSNLTFHNDKLLRIFIEISKLSAHMSYNRKEVINITTATGPKV